MSNLPTKLSTLPATISLKPTFHLTIRTFQLLTTLVTLPLYASSLTHSSSSSSYIYALILLTLTLLTLLIYAIPKVACQKLFLWDFCIAVLWAALAGVFGIVYFDGGKNGRDSAEWVEGQQGRMKVAVWFDLLGMACWIITAGWGCVRCCKVRLQARRLRKEERKMENMLEGQEEGFVLQERDDEIDCEKWLIEEKSEKEVLKGRYDEA